MENFCQELETFVLIWHYFCEKSKIWSKIATFFIKKDGNFSEKIFVKKIERRMWWTYQIFT